MITIDMLRIRNALPKRAKVYLKKKRSSVCTYAYIECIVRWPGLCNGGDDKVFEQAKIRQRSIIGARNIAEFYTQETGMHWYVNLKDVPMQFINATQEDIDVYMGVKVLKLKK